MASSTSSQSFPWGEGEPGSPSTCASCGRVLDDEPEVAGPTLCVECNREFEQQNDVMARLEAQRF